MHFVFATHTYSLRAYFRQTEQVYLRYSSELFITFYHSDISNVFVTFLIKVIDSYFFLYANTTLFPGLLQRSGKFHWIQVKRKFIPKKWKKQTQTKERLRYDFAVLKLKRKHSRKHMSVQISSLLPGSKIQFSGFHGDKWYNSLWYTYCSVYRKANDMILNFCDGVRGVSGSGVYVNSPSRHESAVVGVVSAIVRGKVKGKEFKFNVINSFTGTKVRQISKWVRR